MKPKYINPERRDLLKQLVALGIISAGQTISPLAFSQATANNNALPKIATWKGEEEYITRRKYSLWRGNLPERYPDIIVQPDTLEEIHQALAFAQKNDLQITCRASGHNTSAAVLRNGGMMLDLINFNDISIDPVRKTASVQPSVVMQSLHDEAMKHGLDFPHAECSSVAVTGYILGGGFGKNGQHWAKGLACNTLIDADVLLANGEVVHVDKDNHPDIYWAMRGCGASFFGIVLRCTLQLFEATGAIMSSSYVFKEEALPDVIEFFDKRQDTIDDQVRAGLGLENDKNNPGSIKIKVNLAAYADQGDDPMAEVKQKLSYYVDEGLPDQAVEKKEFQVHGPSDYLYTSNRNYHTTTDNIFTDDASMLIDILDHFREIPRELRYGGLNLTHGMLRGEMNPANSFSVQGAHFVSLILDWAGEELDTEVYDWVKGFSEIAAPYQQGHYLNQVDTEVYPEKIRQSFTPENWKRLQTVRKQYDPDERFFNHVGFI